MVMIGIGVVLLGLRICLAALLATTSRSTLLFAGCTTVNAGIIAIAYSLGGIHT